jgi:hypothetical protein
MRISRVLATMVMGLTLVSGTSLRAGDAPVDAVPPFMAVAFDNTVMSHYPDGGWVKHWFNRDGSYEGRFSDGTRITARWQVDRNKVCLTRIRPGFMLPRFCSDIVEAGIGDSWTARDPLGRRVRNTLVRGRD